MLRAGPICPAPQRESGQNWPQFPAAKTTSMSASGAAATARVSGWFGLLPEFRGSPGGRSVERSYTAQELLSTHGPLKAEKWSLSQGIAATSIQYAAIAQAMKPSGPFRFRIWLGNKARSMIRAWGAMARTRLAIL